MMDKFLKQGASPLKMRVKRISYLIEDMGRQIYLAKEDFEEVGGLESVVEQLCMMESLLKRMETLIPKPEFAHDPEKNN